MSEQMLGAANLAQHVPQLLRQLGPAADPEDVYDSANRGVIPHQRLGKRILFRRGALVTLELPFRGAA